MENHAERRKSRLTVADISSRLNIGRLSVYSMLKKGILPGIRVGQRWIITAAAFEKWEQSCGLKETASAVSKN